ncbi:hypothetical protein EYF80_024138 [Liparis tanakae]|uniref:Uncharacterized protein n=1 Tax=Liparis tanakae TaxID=230148 RepID=A0A4Z2HI75_9TELE|nr:hypothetical protein EYF80_024138 [Liparis tanakae]
MSSLIPQTITYITHHALRFHSTSAAALFLSELKPRTHSLNQLMRPCTELLSAVARQQGHLFPRVVTPRCSGQILIQWHRCAKIGYVFERKSNFGNWIQAYAATFNNTSEQKKKKKIISKHSRHDSPDLRLAELISRASSSRPRRRRRYDSLLNLMAFISAEQRRVSDVVSEIDVKRLIRLYTFMSRKCLPYIFNQSNLLSSSSKLLLSFSPHGSLRHPHAGRLSPDQTEESRRIR